MDCMTSQSPWGLQRLRCFVAHSTLSRDVGLAWMLAGLVGASGQQQGFVPCKAVSKFYCVLNPLQKLKAMGVEGGSRV